MTITELELTGVFHIVPELKTDERGFFSRTFCRDELSNYLPEGFTPVQINLSFNTIKGTLRGMHFQKPPHQEAKIVQCLQGSLYDVAVDLRSNSPTYGKWLGRELTASKKDMLCIPCGFAHGFLTLEPNTLIQYFMTAPYVAESAGGIRYDDPKIAIQWPAVTTIISEKDMQWQLL